MEGVSRTRLEAHLSGDGAAPGDGRAKYAQSSQNEGAGLRVLQLWSARPEHEHRACFLLRLILPILPRRPAAGRTPRSAAALHPDGPSVAIRAAAVPCQYPATAVWDRL